MLEFKLLWLVVIPTFRFSLHMSHSPRNSVV